MKIIIDVKTASSFQKAFIKNTMYDILRTVKSFFETKSKNNKFDFQIKED